ncbi:MAG: glycosyltransferase [Planctomycetota bacterium]
MKVALITTSPSTHSGIGDYTRHLLPYLRELCEVRAYVEPGAEPGELIDGVPMAPVTELSPKDHDRVLYQLGNEGHHRFMPGMVRAIGGTVMQHDWVLFDLACAAYPGLARGGLKGHALALREGGVQQMQRYARNWVDRRSQRVRPIEPEDCDGLPGTLLCGWHESEPKGRWTSDVACFRIPAQGVEEVEVALHLEGSRSARLVEADRPLATATSAGTLLARVHEQQAPLLRLETGGITVTRAQREHGDSRRLGSFVEGVRWRDSSGWTELDLSEPAAHPLVPVTLSRDRFELPFNRSVVRHADSFIVHSKYVANRILADRNTRTPIGILHHGAERRWREEDRREARRRLGLPEAWVDGFLVVSFGGVQPHKRVDRVLRGVAEARRQRDDIHIVLAGKTHAGEFDAERYAHALGLGDAARFTGFVEEQRGWDWMHAGDVCMNLRGPTSGGTSGGIFQAFSNGRTVIASDAAEQRELPDSCVLKVPVGDGEVDALARTLVELRDNPGRRDELEHATRDFVEAECHWSVVARQYAEYLTDFPGPRTTRKAQVAFGVLWR